MTAAASAQSAEAQFEVDKHDPSCLDATLIDAPRLPAAKIALRVAGEPSVPAIYPRTVTSFADGSEPIAIVLVLNGQEIFMGNDDFETDDGTRFFGVLDELRRQLDGLHVEHLGPPGSTITVVSYATGARVIVPKLPLEKFHSYLLGTQKDYRGQIGDDMVAGITAGLRELDASDAPHKLLLVVGDGNDTNNDVAKSELADLKRHAQRENIHIGGIVYKTALSAEGQILSYFDSNMRTANSVSSIVDTIGERMSRVTGRYYVTFCDYRLPWNGKPHDLVLTLDKHDLDQVAVVLPDHREPSIAWWRRAWGQLVIGLGLVGLLIGGVRLSSRV